MKDSEKLQKIFKKATDNGWKKAPLWDESMNWFYYGDAKGGCVVTSVTEILFSHEFLKAYFEDWKLEAQLLVLEPEQTRISYLFSFL